MPTIYVDNVPYGVADGLNLLQACLSLGFDLPYFCWHPAMHSVGACRQCAVKQFHDEKDTRGRIVMACMTPATEGARISIDDPEAKSFRAGVIEWLMLNHPHDCPVCDEGGECHLQDMTYMTGHDYRRYRFEKRTYRNQYLGPFVHHEMNRCIECYRCVRFYRDYAGGRDLDVFGVHDRVYFGRQQDGILESEFSGNLVEVCPTGVFTDETLHQHYTRKWDLQTAPSVCVHCGLGCNTIPGERYGTLRRIRNRFNGDVNGYFLCDRGRYGYEYVNDERRRREPLLRGTDGRLAPSDEALPRLASLLASGRAIGLGSPRASLEGNFALRRLVGPENYYRGVPRKDADLADRIVAILSQGPAPAASLKDVEQADAMLVLGEDLSNTAPRAALALRQAVLQRPVAEAVARLKIPPWDDGAVRRAIQDDKGPLYIATTAATNLDGLAKVAQRAAPAEIARLGYAVAGALAGPAPEGETGETPDLTLAQRIAADLHSAKRPLVVAGTSYRDLDIVNAAAAVAGALHAGGVPARLFYVVPEPNTLGLALLGGAGLEGARAALDEGHADGVIVLENDLYRRADAAWVDEFLAAAQHVATVDSLANATTERAEIVLPAATFAEADGTLVNNEGRAQRFFQVFGATSDSNAESGRSYLQVYLPGGVIQEGWRWLRDAALAAGWEQFGGWQGLDDVIAELVADVPGLAGIRAAAPPASTRIADQKIPRQPQRYSGRTAMFADKVIHEPKPPDDPDAPLSFTMEGYDLQPPPALIPRFWAPGWNSNQALNKFQAEVPGPLRGGNPGVRLLGPAAGQSAGDHGQPPAPFVAHTGRWLVVPHYHIFGSEELSALSPGVASLTPSPYIAFNEADAQKLRLEPGSQLNLVLGGRERSLRVAILPELPAGIAALPAGLPGLAGIELPAWLDLGQA